MLNAEIEWVEFNVNVSKPQEVGKHISALANSALWLARDLPTWFGVFLTGTKSGWDKP